MIRRKTQQTGTGPDTATGGFTLAEVAVTIALVGLALVYMMQSLSTSKITAAYTRNLKLSKELALLTLGRIESGVYEEEIENDRLEGTYAEEGYPDFYFEVVIGEQNFLIEHEEGQFFDNWRYERESYDDDDDDETEQPYEKVRVKVTSPQIRELKNDLLLERWLPWKQLHPPEDDDDSGDSGDTTDI